jgi:hypothetical protein
MVQPLNVPLRDFNEVVLQSSILGSTCTSEDQRMWPRNRSEKIEKLGKTEERPIVHVDGEENGELTSK